MSHTNKQMVDISFDMARQYLKGAVPPCSLTVDTPTHIKIEAINGESKHLFAEAIAHSHVVTIEFSPDIPKEDFDQLISQRLQKHMNEHRRLEIRDLHVDELIHAFQEPCPTLLYY